MTKFLAYLMLVVLNVLNILGNFWFTYGIWPKSWLSFTAFAFMSIFLSAAYVVVREDD